MKRERILVVEDETIVAMDIQRGLKHLGYDVPAVVGSGNEAVAKAGELHPDLILMDIQIKGSKDGIETAREIWDSHRIPVIFLTAYADESTLERAKTSEPFGYILKPFEETELHTAIEVALKKHRSIQEDRIQQQNALLASESRFQLLVDSVRDYAIYMLDPEGRVCSWNVGAKRIKGYEAAEILGKHFSLFYPPEAIATGVPGLILEDAKRCGRHEEEGWSVRKDGATIWANVVATAMRDSSGKMLGFGIVTRDLTERKNAEERNSFLAEVSSVLSYSLDLDITLREMANLVVPHIADWCIIDLLQEDEKVKRVTVAHRDPAKREYARDLQEKYPIDLNSARGVGRVIRARASELIPEISESLLKELALERDEEYVRIVRALGLKSYMSVPLVSRDRVLGAISFVSEGNRPNYKKEDLDLAEELASRAAHAVENSRLYEGAQNAIRVRDEFLSVASHELKTPLTSLRLQAQITKRNLAKGNKAFFTQERLNQMADQLDSHVDRLARLIEDMLDVSRIRIGKMNTRFEEVYLPTLVREIVEKMSHMLAAAGCQARLFLDEDLIGYWDRYRMEQVLVNLLSNAAKYGSGGPIELFARKERDRAILRVKDYGIGISKDDQERIFKRFERAISANEVSGLGLGLYITREILKSHEGTIRVESEPGKGAEFIVELPLRPREHEHERKVLDYEF